MTITPDTPVTRFSGRKGPPRPSWKALGILRAAICSPTPGTTRTGAGSGPFGLPLGRRSASPPLRRSAPSPTSAKGDGAG